MHNMLEINILKNVSEVICLPTVKWFQVLLLFIIFSRLKLATMRPVSLSILYTIGSLLGLSIALFIIIIGDLVLDVEVTVWILFEGNLNVLPDLSLFTFVFICIFLAWPMGACSV